MPKNSKYLTTNSSQDKELIWESKITSGILSGDHVRARYAISHQNIIEKRKEKRSRIEENKVTLIYKDSHTSFKVKIENINKCLYNHTSRNTSTLGKALQEAVKVKSQYTELFFDDDVDSIESVIRLIKRSLNKDLYFICADTQHSSILSLDENNRENIVIEDANPQVVRALPAFIKEVSLNAYTTAEAIHALKKDLQTIQLYSLNLNSNALKALLQYVSENKNTNIIFHASTEPVSLNGLKIDYLSSVLTGTNDVTDSSQIIFFDEATIRKNLNMIASLLQNNANSTITANLNNDEEVNAYFLINLLCDDALDAQTALLFLNVLSAQQKMNLLNFCNYALPQLSHSHIPTMQNQTNTGMGIQNSMLQYNPAPNPASNYQQALQQNQFMMQVLDELLAQNQMLTLALRGAISTPPYDLVNTTQIPQTTAGFNSSNNNSANNNYSYSGFNAQPSSNTYSSSMPAVYATSPSPFVGVGQALQPTQYYSSSLHDQFNQIPNQQPMPVNGGNFGSVQQVQQPGAATLNMFSLFNHPVNVPTTSSGLANNATTTANSNNTPATTATTAFPPVAAATSIINPPATVTIINPPATVNALATSNTGRNNPGQFSIPSSPFSLLFNLFNPQSPQAAGQQNPNTPSAGGQQNPNTPSAGGQQNPNTPQPYSFGLGGKRPS